MNIIGHRIRFPTYSRLKVYQITEPLRPDKKISRHIASVIWSPFDPEAKIVVFFIECETVNLRPLSHPCTHDVEERVKQFWLSSLLLIDVLLVIPDARWPWEVMMHLDTDQALLHRLVAADGRTADMDWSGTGTQVILLSLLSVITMVVLMAMCTCRESAKS